MLTQYYQGAPTSTVTPYQTTQNIAARMTYKKSKREDVYICLQELHWLCIKYRTMFKVVYNTLQGKAPQYLREKIKTKALS